MRIQAEICFTDPCDPDGAVAALRERGYRIDKIQDLRDDAAVDAVFVHASRDVTGAELTADVVNAAKLSAQAGGMSPEHVIDDRWAASCLVLDESGTIVAPFGGYSDNAG
jgi:hypothetical protein